MADLPEGTDEYRDPVEFFRRTYLTDSLRRLLTGAVQRLSGSGGDPVVQLQTNFGGGKTHSMLALFHLFSGVLPSGLAGIDQVRPSMIGSASQSSRRWGHDSRLDPRLRSCGGRHRSCARLAHRPSISQVVAAAWTVPSSAGK